jgi:hypothetical protein
MTCQPEWFTPSHEYGKTLKEVGQVGEKTVFLEDEEGAIQDV